MAKRSKVRVIYYDKIGRDKIAERAYHKWKEAGSPQGHDGKEFWLAAERELTKADVSLQEVDSSSL